MRYDFSPEFVSRFPTFTRFVIVARGVDNRSESAELKQMLNDAALAVRSDASLAMPAQHPKLAPWDAAFRSFGADPAETLPSITSLIVRARRPSLEPGETIFAYHNTLVALSNYISLIHLIPSGADDLGLAHGDVGLRLATGKELFVGFASNRVERPAAGEVIFADKRKVMCRRHSASSTAG